MDRPAPPDDLVALLNRCGFGQRPIRLRPCHKGGNNQVDAIEVDGRHMVAKRYYRGPGNARDRLDSEWRFLVYCQRLGVDCVPRPLARDEAAGLALYEHIDGKKPAPGEIGRNEVAAAAAFFLALNSKQRAAATELPTAAEACFSIGDHLALVDRRIARLGEIEGASAVDSRAAALAGELALRWKRIRATAASQSQDLGWALDAELSWEDRCISPSDFGFHNAIVRPSGAMCFVDFEYAGWDDPAKMAADFFCQPAIPVSADLRDGFLETTMAFAENRIRLRDRARVLFPVLGIKWCCIMLNDFVPEFARRRTFADPRADVEARKHLQLHKAEHALDSLPG